MSGVHINTLWWSGPINFRAAKVLSFFLFLNHTFPSSSSMPRPLAYRHSLLSLIDVARSFWKPVTKSCSSHVGLNSRWVGNVTTTLQLKTFVLKRPRHRAMTALSPRCQRTKAFKDWRFINCLPRVGWRFADGDGYRSKEPINVSNVPFPFSPRGGFLYGNSAPLFFTCFDYVVLL
jgi:hypothetical protein